MADLLELRNQIDQVDHEIVRLFETRMSLVEGVAESKLETGKQVFDPKRENEKLEQLRRLASTAFNQTGVEEIFRQLMSISRKRQYQMLVDNHRADGIGFNKVEHLNFSEIDVVFQGVEGAYSFAAMKQFFGQDVKSRHVETWTEALEMVANRTVQYAVLPIENSTAGIVSDIYDLMLEYPVYIVGEELLRIEHKLMAKKGTRPEEIQKVYSHPQALAQCKEFLSAHPAYHQEAMLNTAVAAQKVASDEDPHSAAIASSAAAEQFGLEILFSEGLSEKKNETRFIIIAAEPIFEVAANSISICFELPHECGTLYTILSHFIFNRLNLTKIESRPIAGRPWEYRFFIDFDGNLEESGVKNALFGIKEETKDLRILGNYRSAK